MGSFAWSSGVLALSVGIHRRAKTLIFLLPSGLLQSRGRSKKCSTTFRPSMTCEHRKGHTLQGKAKRRGEPTFDYVRFEVLGLLEVNIQCCHWVGAVL